MIVPNVLSPKTDLFGLIFLIINFVVSGTAGTNPIVHLRQLEFPQLTYFIGWHISFSDPLQNGFSANAKVCLDFF